jgi:hypothetical protein
MSLEGEEKSWEIYKIMEFFNTLENKDFQQAA